MISREPHRFLFDKESFMMNNGKPRDLVPLIFAAMGLLGTLGTVGWFYSTMQVDSIMSEMKSTLQSLEIELEMLRKDSCAPRHRAGPFGSLKPAAVLHPAVIPEEEASNPVLAALLKELAVDKEIIVVLANEFACKMLKVQVESVRRVGIPNYLVVALDKPAAEFCQQHQISVYERFGLSDPANRIPMPIAMILSGLKFHVLREFLVLGYNVLLSDVDIVFLQNPLHHLYRDSDFEGMSDGFNNATAYGYLDVFDDPPMGPCHITLTPRLWSFNSGFFYLRATIPTIALLDRVYHRVSKQPTLWDQAVFNEELMYPSRPGYEGLHLSKRVMDYLLFMNSKTLFSDVRGNQRYASLRPITVHLNYHKTKVERMEAVVDYYVNGNQTALDSFPVGDPV